MKLETFEDMEVWQDARALVKSIYGVTSVSAFARDYALRDQLRRASISIMSNIAEGFDRASNKDFMRFLSISKASASEVRSQLYIALDLNYLDEQAFEELKTRAISISRQLSAFMKYLKQSEVY